jgi:hypothetical protein
MAIRHLVVAALMASAGIAHAGMISSNTSSHAAAFLSGWTTGNGTSVIGSGVLSNNVNLIGGIAYGGSGGQAGSLADALLGKASGTLGSAAASTKLYYTKGIEGMYLLGAGHGVLAAMLGNGVSVVGSNDGVLVSQGSTAGATLNLPNGNAVSIPAHAALQLPPQAKPTVAVVPEPSTVALMLAGVLGAGGFLRRRR